MLNEILFLSYIAHFIGDFFLQTNYIASRKTFSYNYTLIHSSLYLIPFALIWLLFQCNINVLWCVIVLGLSHAVVDVIKCFCSIHQSSVNHKFLKKCVEGKYLFLIDQMIHYVIIFATVIGMQHLWGDVEMIVPIPIIILAILLHIVVFTRPSYIAYKMIVTPNSKICRLFSIEQTKLSISILALSSVFVYRVALGIALSAVLYLFSTQKWNKNREIMVNTILFIAISSVLYKHCIMFLFYI